LKTVLSGIAYNIYFLPNNTSKFQKMHIYRYLRAGFEKTFLDRYKPFTIVAGSGNDNNNNIIVVILM